MYAIVDIAGQQFKVEKDNKLFVHRLENEEGTQVSLDKVLLIDNDGKVKVGTPVVEGASIVAKVVSHVKGDKVLVFKKKRRKGYQVLNGHRQFFTEIIVEDILESGSAKSTAKKATPKKEEVKDEAPVAEKEVKKAAPKKAAEPKKAAAKKPAAKKAATPKAEDKNNTKAESKE